MRRTFVAFVAAGSLLLPGAFAQQQSEQAREERIEQAKQRMEEIRQRLNLTPEQQEQIRPILMEEFERLRALRERAGSGSRRDRRQMARELRDIQSDTEKKLKPILTPEQMEEYRKIREEARSRFREQMRNRR
ncbi:MAG: hypothetical protein IRZ15_14390 [Bryobacteraceae bacterium]|nr:hypothetical protein [Bryobacteraceae bacterium]